VGISRGLQFPSPEKSLVPKTIGVRNLHQILYSLPNIFIFFFDRFFQINNDKPIRRLIRKGTQAPQLPAVDFSFSRNVRNYAR